VLNVTVPNLAPDQTLYAAPLLSLPESPERFPLQALNTDTGWGDQDRKLLFTPWAQFLQPGRGSVNQESSTMVMNHTGTPGVKIVASEHGGMIAACDPEGKVVSMMSGNEEDNEDDYGKGGS